MGNTQKTRYIFVTGGVISGLGKGITAASIGAVLKARGIKVSMQKLDVYLNVDAGLLNPREHGECFVTKDGAETDLDLGHYERFLDEEFTSDSSVMSGRILLNLINAERSGYFRGDDVQIVPHLTSEIEKYVMKAGEGSDIHIVEIGGTVGDIESDAFLEAVRQMALNHPGRCAFVHVVYVPYISTSKEFKTKPAQNSMRDLRGIGIMPDIVAVRAEGPLPDYVRDKISLFGGLPKEAVVMLPNADTVYRVPRTLYDSGIGWIFFKKFGMTPKEPAMAKWDKLIEAATTKYKDTVRIGVIAKYLDNEDTYLSVIEALRAAAWHNQVNLAFDWVDAEKIEKHGAGSLSQYDGLLVPGGFGSRGLEGMVACARYAMDNQLPYLGICLGMQMAVVAAARKAGLEDAISSEVQPGAKHPVIYIMAGQEGKESTGGTLRLGNYPCVIQKGSLAEKVYGSTDIIERHRHRYEVNQKYTEYYEKAGLSLSGKSPNGKLVEMIEHTNHPYFIGTQAHPEFKSRPDRPHVLFDGLVKAAIVRQQKSATA
ncbi:MAG TPA: CTP synthase [Candidatus Saccharimonadales bacterium]|nr:CTP synthase [Candidatus Saccharimonadales bacterium]